jgi:hypothetical protein
MAQRVASRQERSVVPAVGNRLFCCCFLTLACFGEELRAAAERGEPDDGSRYYIHWLAALELERLITEKGLTSREAMQERKEAWAEAYRHTPHGKPVELTAGLTNHEHS